MDAPGELLEGEDPGTDDEALDVDETERDDAPESDESPQPTASGAAALDRKQAVDAYRKVLAGQELTVRERAALKRHEKEKEERLRWQYYASIPQKHWRQMSGRQTKVINEQATRYEIPFGGATINLPAVVRGIHDFLADNAVKLARDDDALMQGNGSPALERYREERTALVRLDRLEREGELIPRDEAREALARIAVIIRGAGEALQRQYGQQAGELLFEAMDDAQREMDRFFGTDMQGTATEPERDDAGPEPESEAEPERESPEPQRERDEDPEPDSTN